MHSVSVIIIVLAHAGRWLAGTTEIVSVRWTVPTETPAATLSWALFLGTTQLDAGSAQLNGKDQPTNIRIKCPAVRARSVLELRYHLLSRDGKRELASGRLPVQAFPDDLTDGWARLLQGKNVEVVDSRNELSSLMKKAEVSCERLDDVSQLRFQHPDIVLVAEDQLDDSPFLQGFLLSQARAGAGVLVLRQSQVRTLMGFCVVPRAHPRRLIWKSEDPLLAGLSIDDLNSLTDNLPNGVDAIRAAADRSIVAIAGWPRESTNSSSAMSSDLLLANQSTGRGRIIYCQLNLESWTNDPRTQLLIGNALDSLKTAPESLEPLAPERRPGIAQARPGWVLTPSGDHQ